MDVSADYPGGSIEVVRVGARGPVELALRDDSAADIRQWFDFRLASERRREVAIVNAGDATFPAGWPGYRVLASEGRAWRRVPTRYVDGVLTFAHEPRGPVTRYAYFAPYALARLERLLGRVDRAPHVDVRTLGESAEGRPLWELEIGDEDADTVVWLLGRQHPGESPGSWVLEGLLRRLADADDPATQALLGAAVVRLVPMANPDGVERGNTRTSATGANLNRCWDDPDDDSPEVARLLERIAETGVDLFLDVHADEAASYAFAAKCEGNPSYDARLAAAEDALGDALAGACHEFLDRPFYDLDAPGEGDLSTASNQVGERFGCPALTLELPFKDDGFEAVRPGWSPARALRFGAALVDVLAQQVGAAPDEEDG